MSEGTMEHRSGAHAEWTIRLECGHEVEVPWGYRSPAVAACVVRHRAQCEAPPVDLSGVAWWAAPLGLPSLPAFR